MDDELSTAFHAPSVAADKVKVSAYVVTVIEGPDQGQTVTVDGTQPGRVLVGKSEVCALKLTDRSVSRRHAALDVSEHGLRVTDLESTNGTFIGTARIVEAHLTGGEIIRLGKTALSVAADGPPKTVTIPSAAGFGRMMGASVEMRRLYPLCERLAATDVPVVIEGETGTGKEVLAEALHAQGPRAKGPFMVFDCTMVQANLMESELFGHERGAFTGAVDTRKGVFEQAHGGTLFIDEIGDLELAMQPKLLRALQRSEIRRVGGDRWIKLDVRVIAATRRDLDAEVQAGRFRDDLFFRLAVARIELPPLRSRGGDIAALARHFWTVLGGEGALPFEILKWCELHPWPGNVRELYNEMARRVAIGDLDDRWTTRPAVPSPSAPVASVAAVADDFIEHLLALDLPLPRAREKMVDEFLRRYVERVVDKHGGNIVHAAAASGIAHRYFQLIRRRQAKG